MTEVVVIGGGITGLAASYRLASRPDPPERIILLESSNRLGGKLRTTDFAGRPIDEGADAFLSRVPWATELCEDLGLADELISPNRGPSFVYSRGKVRRIPDGLVLGVPPSIPPVLRSGIVSPTAAARAALDLVLPRTSYGDDPSVGEIVRSRLGDDIAERFVDTLLGSIYAADIDRLSAASTFPQLSSAVESGRSLLLALRAQRRANPPDPTAPAFYSFADGLGRLVSALRDELDRLGVEVVLDSPVSTITSEADRLVVTSGSGDLAADAVVATAPAHVTRQMVSSASPVAAGALGSITYASVALVTMDVAESAVEHALDGNGVLVPKPEQRFVTAASFGSTKWRHWKRPGMVTFRVSAGRIGDSRVDEMNDSEVVAAMSHELGHLVGMKGEPDRVRVSRWPRSFPQYEPGHSAKVAAARSALSRDLPGLLLAGAAYDGIGVPACIRQGGEAAEAAAAHLVG